MNNEKNKIIPVSVIIPVYNISAYISKCLDSCLNQTFSNIEIIVVNDGSTDPSLGIIKRYAQKDNRIVVVNKRNEGLLLARKSGLDIAQGTYVLHLDGDDFLERNAIELLYSKVIESNLDLIVGGLFTDTNDVAVYANILDTGIWNKQYFLHYIIDNCFFSVCGKLIKRSIHNEIEFLVTTIGEDAVHLLQLCNKCNQIYVVNEGVYHYVKRSDSIMNDSNQDLRANRELECTKALFNLTNIVAFDENIRVKIIAIGLEKLCFYLRIAGKYGESKNWIKMFIKKEFLNSVENRSYMYKKNKLIYCMLFIERFSPLLAKRLSCIRNL